MIYKAISLKQPWANLLAGGKKTIETRRWSTRYRGDLVVCSSQNPKIEPCGKALCIIELYGVRPMTKRDEKKACIRLYPGAYAWLLRNLRPISPAIPVKGSLGIFDLKLNF